MWRRGLGLGSHASALAHTGILTHDLLVPNLFQMAPTPLFCDSDLERIWNGSNPRTNARKKKKFEFEFFFESVFFSLF